MSQLSGENDSVAPFVVVVHEDILKGLQKNQNLLKQLLSVSATSGAQHGSSPTLDRYVLVLWARPDLCFFLFKIMNLH